MNKINKGTGAGGSRTNDTGLLFEKKMYLYKWLINAGYALKPIEKSTSRSQLFEIHKNKKLIGYYGRQAKLYNLLKLKWPISFNQEIINEILSRKIHPDAFVLNVKTKKLIIFEKKWQQSSGSVDEKIQTAPFKIYVLQKLLNKINYKVEYHYILSKWFQNPGYRNVREYYSKNKYVKIWIEGINLDILKNLREIVI